MIETGYQGWWSIEVFNTSLEEKDEGCPKRHGVRGLKCLRDLRKEVEGSASGTKKGVDERVVEL